VIDDQRKQYPVALMCRALGVSVSGFYAWRSRPEPRRAREDRRLAALLRTEFKRKRGAYGSPRMYRELRRKGETVGRRRTARIMRQQGLVARPRRRRVKTTDSSTTKRIAPNRLDRNFTVGVRDRVWAADITYLATFAGPLYLAVEIDLHARRVVGWAIAPHMRDELVLEALQMAVRTRRPQPGLVHHSDRGSQYASNDFLAELERQQMVASMSGKGDCWDNAVAESFFATLKTELGSTFADFDHARQAVAEYIGFYNFERIHSTLGYRSPASAELTPTPRPEPHS
jgi:putative transposase